MENSEYRMMKTIPRDHWWFLHRRILLETLLPRLVRQYDRVLDLGCGIGSEKFWLERYGEYTGIELTPAAFEHAFSEAKQSMVCGNGSELPFGTATFSLVSLMDVLYHREVHPEHVLHESARVLKSRGVLLITDSAMPELAGEHDRVNQGVRRWYRQELVDLVHRCDLEVVYSNYMFTFLYPLVYVYRKVVKGAADGTSGSDLKTWNPLLNRVLNVFHSLERTLLRKYQMPFGSSVIILAIKPEA